MGAEVFRVLGREYRLRHVERLESPRLLVFRHLVEENISRLRALLEGVAPGSAFRRLRSHAKTCKASWAIDLQLRAGITRFKASPNELGMLLAAGARDIFMAYPPLPHLAERLASALALARNVTAPPLRLLAQVSAAEHISALSAAASRHGVEIPCLIDLDVGMGRTGAPPERAPELLRALQAAGRLPYAGLHAYDGHIRGANAGERAVEAEKAMDRVVRCAEALAGLGARTPLIVAGGTPGFLPDLERLLRSGASDEVEVSPGTWIYWDSNYDARMKGMFALAALVLARVMDRTGPDRATLDLGHKRWAIDAGPLGVFSREGLEVISTSEEHTVLRETASPGGLRIGDPLLLAPRHVCPTVNLWEDFLVIGPGGEVEVPACPVDARNR